MFCCVAAVLEVCSPNGVRRLKSQRWFSVGSALVQRWFSVGSALVQRWFSVGSALVHLIIIIDFFFVDVMFTHSIV
jgi:hypothetical protein